MPILEMRVNLMTEFNKLLHELHQVPIVEKPTLGQKSICSTIFWTGGTHLLKELDTRLPEIPEQVESRI